MEINTCFPSRRLFIDKSLIEFKIPASYLTTHQEWYCFITGALPRNNVLPGERTLVSLNVNVCDIKFYRPLTLR
jgi:hypothetical protein